MEIDRAYLPAWHDYLRLTYETSAETELRRRMDAGWPGMDGLTPCVRIVLRNLVSEWPMLRDRGQALLAHERDTGGNACTAFFLARSGVPEASGGSGRRVERFSEVLRWEPELGAAWWHKIGALAANGRHSASDSTGREAAARRLHPLERMKIDITLAGTIASRGDTATAQQLMSRAAAVLARDPRPGIRYEFAARPFHKPSGDLRERVALARAYRATFRELENLNELGHHALDRGDPAAALAHHDAELALLRGLDAPRLQLKAYVRRGRALSKLGRAKEAERDLLRAIQVGKQVGDAYYLAESYHNLAHSYESVGRWRDATRAAEAFVATARTIDNRAMAIVGMHDAGTIQWKAGWHATAGQTFSAMVRAIDAIGQEHYWAGEYFERSGDLERALHYYRRAAGTSDVTRGLQALVRVHAMMGDLSAAEEAARRHDALRSHWQPLDKPLLPRILAQRGRVREALLLAREWRERQHAAGNVHGHAIAALDLAELLASAGAHADARSAAQFAAQLARAHHLEEELIQALRLSGEMTVRLADPAAGLTILREASARALQFAAVGPVLSTHVALGDALARAGKPREALAAYSRAATAVETVTNHLESDLERARYRAGQIQAYDGAILSALRLAETGGEFDDLLAWSARRKAAGLRAALRDVSNGAPRGGAGASLAGVRRQLSEDEAFLEYFVAGSHVAVAAVTRDSAAVVRLELSEDSLRATVERWRRRLATSYRGAIDVARARFDYDAAHSLYRSVLAPALTAAGNPRRLIISPDGPLHYVPFEALVSGLPAGAPSSTVAGRGAGAGVSFVIDTHSVVYVPSAAFVRRRAPRYVTASAKLLVLAGDAPAADAEARAIAAAWPRQRVSLLTGVHATESSLRNVGEFQMLHIAAHALADGRDALASHLRLRADAEHDGYVHLSEISAAKHMPELVVLSACETVSGPLYRGEGPLGIARAFLLGGSTSVVATQWPVGAPNAELMRIFYGEIAAGADPATALTTARRALRSRPATAHPLFWAGTIFITS